MNQLKTKNYEKTEQERHHQALAEFVIPAVFWAETELLKNEPEWVERVKDAPEEEREELAQEYCTAIAHIILREPNKKNQEL